MIPFMLIGLTVHSDSFKVLSPMIKKLVYGCKIRYSKLKSPFIEKFTNS